MSPVGVQALKAVRQIPFLERWGRPVAPYVNVIKDIKPLQQVLLVSTLVSSLSYALSVSRDNVDLDRHYSELLESRGELDKSRGVVDSYTESYPRVDSRVIEAINGVEIISTYAISHGKYASNTLCFEVLHTLSWCLVHDRGVRIELLIPLHGPGYWLLTSPIGSISTGYNRGRCRTSEGCSIATLWHLQF